MQVNGTPFIQVILYIIFTIVKSIEVQNTFLQDYFETNIQLIILLNRSISEIRKCVHEKNCTHPQAILTLIV